MNGNVTKDGIRAVLEDIRRAGLHGVQLFNARTREGAGPLKYGSAGVDRSRQVRHVLGEGTRSGVYHHERRRLVEQRRPLGHPERSMKTMVWSEDTARPRRRHREADPARAAEDTRFLS